MCIRGVEMEYRYRVIGIDCADCAAELADEIRKIEGCTECRYPFYATEDVLCL